MMAGFLDIHSHFVYGMDDGAKTLQDMQAMLDAAYNNGIATLYATPHVTPGVKPFDEETYLAHLNEGRAYVQQKGYDLVLFSGAELLYTPFMPRYIQDKGLPLLEGTDSVLVEFTPDVAYAELEAAVDAMETAGYLPILAHIERYRCLTQGRRAWKLKENHDVCYQVNASTTIKKRGFLLDMTVRNWFKDELIDCVASDAHSLTHRPYQMKEAYFALEKQVGEDYARRLVGL